MVYKQKHQKGDFKAKRNKDGWGGRRLNWLEMTILKSIANLIKINRRWCSSFKFRQPTKLLPTTFRESAHFLLNWSNTKERFPFFQKAGYCTLTEWNSWNLVLALKQEGKKMKGHLICLCKMMIYVIANAQNNAHSNYNVTTVTKLTNHKAGWKQ